MMKKYNNISKKSKCDSEEILDNSLCGSIPAEKLGHFFFYIILNGREFLSSRGHSSYLNGQYPAPMAPMH